MTDSTTDAQSADGGFDVGSSVDDLFGEIESDGGSGSDQRAETADGDGSDAVEDQTAADIFDQLRTDAGGQSGTDDILADESPDDIIASADEPDPEPDATVDADLLADDDELANLLLTGRSKETDGEFLWIDPADDAGTDGVETGDDGRLEGSADATPAWGSDDATDDATDDTADVEQPDADESITDDTDDDVDIDESLSPNDTEAEPATSSTPEIIADDGSETIADSSDDTDEIDEIDETTPEPAADGDDAEEESDRTDADDAPSGPLSKVRSTLGGLF